MEVVPGYVTNVITDDALAFIDEHAEDENPFYLSVNYTAPHSPWVGHPQDIVDSYDDTAFDSCPQEDRHPWASESAEDRKQPIGTGGNVLLRGATVEPLSTARVPEPEYRKNLIRIHAVFEELGLPVVFMTAPTGH